MICPECNASFNGKRTVMNTCPDEFTTIRRRVCPDCKTATFTAEIPITHHKVYATSGRGKYFIQDAYLKQLLKATYT